MCARGRRAPGLGVDLAAVFGSTVDFFDLAAVFGSTVDFFDLAAVFGSTGELFDLGFIANLIAANMATIELTK